jgi:hypothetical protein
MARQGRCVLPPDELGRILDRLAGLEKIITPALVRQVLLVTKCCNQRACMLTHEVLLWVVLAMGILTDLPIRQVFKIAGPDSDEPHLRLIIRPSSGLLCISCQHHVVTRRP